MKKYLLILISSVLFSNTVFAMSNPIVDTVTSGDIITNTRQVEILNIIKQESEFMLNFLPVNSTLTDIKLPETVYIQAGLREYIECCIQWEDIENVDTSKASRVTLKGNILPPQNIEFIGGLDPVVEMPFIIYDDNNTAVETAQVVEYENFPILVPLGANAIDYLNTKTIYPFQTENGDIFYTTVNWTYVPKTDTQGKVYAKGEFLLPKGIAPVDDNSKYITQELFVMNDEDIYLEYIIKTNITVSCEWIKSIEDYENIIAEYSTDGTSWANAQELVYVDDDGMYINIYSLESYVPYLFRLKYNNKTYGNVSVRVTDEEIDASFLDGDRDLGDNSSEDLPDYTEPKRTNSGGGMKKSNVANETITEFQYETTSETTTEHSEETTEAETINTVPEENTPSKTVVTGERLYEQAVVQGNYVVFEKQGVSLEIPSKFIADNHISKNDMVTVNINKYQNNVDIDVSINNKPVDNIEGAKISVNDSDDTPQKINIDNTGEYTISNNEDDNNDYTSFIAISAILLVLGGWLIVWRRKK